VAARRKREATGRQEHVRRARAARKEQSGERTQLSKAKAREQRQQQ
jgi:hypothetical protein